MRLPRDLSGDALAQSLQNLGYHVDHQTDGHLRLTTSREGEHHVTVPRHGFVRIGTLSAILADVALHFGLSREELVRLLRL